MRKLFAAIATVGLWTLLSRVLGLVREIMLSRAIGAGGSPVADAFFTAFRLPNMFRRFIAEGAFHAGFVPLFTKRIGDAERARAFAQSAFSGLFAVSFLLVIFVQIFTAGFVLLLSAGFVGDARFDLAIGYTRITIFYIVFMSLAGLLTAVLNSFERFSLAAAAPVLLNVIFIVVLVAMLFFPELQIETRGLILSWTVLVGGALQFIVLWLGARRIGFSLIPRRPIWNDDMRDLLGKMLPAALTVGVMQINLLVGTQVASITQGAQGWLYYADRLYQLPLGLIGIAIGTVLLPVLSRHLRDGEYDEARKRFNESFAFGAVLTLPAAIALIVIPVPLIAVLYEGGQFTALDTKNTATALMIYGIGLPSFVLNQLLNRVFFAHEDTKTPFRYALVSMVVNLVIAVGLFSYIGFLAAAWATVAASWVMTVLLWIGARRFGQIAVLAASFRRAIVGALIASIAMGGLAYYLAQLWSQYFNDGLIGWAFLSALVVIVGVFYFAVLIPLSGLGRRDLKRFVGR